MNAGAAISNPDWFDLGFVAVAKTAGVLAGFHHPTIRNDAEILRVLLRRQELSCG